MSGISFSAFEFISDGTFHQTAYEYHGTPEKGWEILRDGKCYLKLGPGYIPIQTLHCGICSTDIGRNKLPFPLPQVTGHEIIGIKDGKPVAVEINASHKARGHHMDSCPYCCSGMDSHCPERLTLGINQLPGGFSPWILAPVNAIHLIPEEINPLVATLIEPLAAALRAIELSPPSEGEKVAIVGPRRLGMLIIAALSHLRNRNDINFSISAVIRHDILEKLCIALGANDIINTRQSSINNYRHKFDIVYDTSGSTHGFENALTLTNKILHLKSTHGLECLGLKQMTSMVVNEISLLPFNYLNTINNLESFDIKSSVRSVYLSPTVDIAFSEKLKNLCPKGTMYQTDITDSEKETNNYLSCPLIPGFDLSIVTTSNEIDRLLSPGENSNKILIKPGGAIILAPQSKSRSSPDQSLLVDEIKSRNLAIHTSRCGDFQKAIQLLQSEPKMAKLLEQQFITHVLDIDDINNAFKLAMDSEKSIKIILKHKIE